MTSVELPNGTIVRGCGIANRGANTRWRDFGIYLDPAWEPEWPAVLVDWPDFGLPASDEVAFQAIKDAFDRARSGARVEVGCLGGLGRTGTVLACFAVCCGLSAERAVEWVRANYDKRAIETLDQEAWVAWFAKRLAAGNGAEN